MNNKIIIIGITIFSIVLLIASYFIFNAPSKPQQKVLSYALQDKEKPEVEMKESFKDLGTIKVSSTQTAVFTLRNTGSKPLLLSNINSNCGCTAGQIIYNGVESKEYGMHSQSEDVFNISPKTEAKVRITYRPFTMPVYGRVLREVYITTNDPKKPKLIFNIQAIVQ